VTGTGSGSRVSTSVPGPNGWLGYERGSSGYRRILVALGAAGVATFAQLYSPQGILPLIGRGLRVDAASSAMTVSVATLGLAVSVLGWSWAADRIGRAQAMKIALLAAAVIGFAAPLSPQLGVLLALRTLEGIALGGVPALAVAYLHEEVHPQQAPVAAGTYISGTTIGGLLGRLVAAPFAALGGWRSGMVAVAVLAALAVVIFWLIVPPTRGFVTVRGRRDSVTDPRPESPASDSVPDSRSGARRTLATLWRHLRNRRLLVLYAQAFLLMGGFVATYNYLGYRLERPPFDIPVTVTALIFLAYLGGTVSSRVAGGLAVRFGRRAVLLVSVATMAAGILATIPDRLPLILAGLLVMTAGFFGAHSIASGWVGARARSGRAQATSLYNLFYYAGSSLFGWLGGLAFLAGWIGTAVMVACLAGCALLVAVSGARD